MIRLHYSNRTERLLEALAEELALRQDPLEPVTIVVPNRPMERWVEMRLAERLGIAANVRFVRLERFVAERLAGPSGRKVLSTAVIEGRLLALLLGPLGRGDGEGGADAEALAPLRRYLRAAGDDEGAIERRATQLARRLSRLFQEYGFSRPRMLEAWERGEAVFGASALAETSFAETAFGETALAETERWQAALYRAARAMGDPQTEAFSLAEARRGMTAAPGRPAHLFGVSYMARVFQEVLGALAESTELHVYALNPCAEFWEDARSDREARRSLRRARSASAEDPLALLSDVDNALLRAWGRPGREHVALLDEQTGFDARAAFEDPGQGSWLSRVQSAILHRREVAQGPVDDSLRLFACPSVRREIETLAAEIWAAVDAASATAKPLRWGEIAVLINGADRDVYMPHLEAVFAESHELPWNAADLRLASRSRVADCALRLLSLPGSAFTRAEVLDVLLHPLVLARFPDADPTRLAALVARLGVFHGIDDADHRGTYLEGSGRVHWDQGVRRLALGALMEGERDGQDATFELSGMALSPEESAGSDELAQGLGLLVRSLAADARFAKDARMPPKQWARFFQAMLRAYLVVGEGDEESELRRCLSALSALDERDVGEPVGFRVAVELARAELESLSASRGVPLGDGVVVASLLPMRAIPFRVIFVLGLGEGRFPARALDTGLDLRAGRREPGDVAPDERDRYTFLETLLCARERLVLSWVARDEASGEARPPSSVIHTLEEALGAPLPREAPRLRRHEAIAEGLSPIRAHALPAAIAEAEARAQGAPHRRALAEARFPEGALAGLREGDPRRALLAMPPLPPPPEEARLSQLSLDDVIRFLECPIQGHARLSIGRAHDAPDAAAEDEPFEALPTERERVLIEALVRSLEQDEDALLQVYEACVSRSAARGRWPVGELAALRRQEDLLDLRAWRLAMARWEEGARLSRVRFGGSRGQAGEAARERPHEPLAIALDEARLGGASGGGLEGLGIAGLSLGGLGGLGLGGLGLGGPGLGGLGLGGPGELASGGAASSGERAARVAHLVGRTGFYLPSGEGVVPTLRGGLDGDGERARVTRLHLALRAFVEHAALAAAGLGGQGTRRVWVLDRQSEGPLVVQLAPMRKEAAQRWLAGVIDELLDGPRGLFLPCEAALRLETLFTRGAQDPAGELSRSIEQVRSKSMWEGGSSRFGPVRDAVEYPAPEPELAMAMAGRRFRTFFEHVRGIRRAS